MATSLKVAVIGAGVSGLTAARELRRESHNVVVFEKSHQLGGTWAYDPRVESDLLGLDPNREIVHGSLYKSLRTNLPRKLMSFTDFKLGEKEYGDPRMFPGHTEILKFLEDFARNFQITELIRFNTVVTRVEAVDSGITEFVVESLTVQVSSVEVFDAVVVCSGSNTRPRLANDIPGIKTWTKMHMHSHNYRVPEPFRNQIVVVIGSGPSGMELSREIAMVAKEVHMSSRSPNVKVLKLEKFHNIWQHSKGLTFQIVECQSRWIAQALSRKVTLPSEEEMLCNVEEHYREMKENGISEHDTHSVKFKSDYMDWISAQFGMVLEKGLQEMFTYLIHCFISNPDGYKDEFSIKYGI